MELRPRRDYAGNVRRDLAKREHGLHSTERQATVVLPAKSNRVDTPRPRVQVEKRRGDCARVRNRREFFRACRRTHSWQTTAVAYAHKAPG